MATKNLGYQKDFLGKALPFPAVDKTLLAPLLSGNGNEVVYTHYSSFVHATRLLPLFCAVNIKGEQYSAPGRVGNEPWDFTDQVEKKYQLDNGFYGKDKNTFDRGHIVRRVDPCWGSQQTADQAEQETFRWSNCTPQHKKLNQKGGVWFELEQHVMEKGAKNKIADISVFAGPVLAADDLPFIVPYKGKDVKVPVVFWKVIVWKKSDGKLYAVGFMMSQWEWIKTKLKKPAAALRGVKKIAKPKLDDEYFENLKFSDHKTYQVPISAIEKATGIKFNWPSVNFPFRQKKFKTISGVPLNNVRAFSAIAAVKREGAFSGPARQLRVVKPMTRLEVSRAIKSKYTSAIKQFELKGVKL